MRCPICNMSSHNEVQCLVLQMRCTICKMSGHKEVQCRFSGARLKISQDSNDKNIIMSQNTPIEKQQSTFGP